MRHGDLWTMGAADAGLCCGRRCCADGSHRPEGVCWIIGPTFRRSSAAPGSAAVGSGTSGVSPGRAGTSQAPAPHHAGAAGERLEEGAADWGLRAPMRETGFAGFADWGLLGDRGAAGSSVATSLRWCWA
mmetsp:Transcript_25627/g.88049  ORF Transcript_25627/g.88049 Transcript_25627/m.88049 type:complete len:130 (+) Transcript_25627:46-435(+)